MYVLVFFMYVYLLCMYVHLYVCMCICMNVDTCGAMVMAMGNVTPTAPLQRGKTLPTSVLDMTLNNLMVRFQ